MSQPAFSEPVAAPAAAPASQPASEPSTGGGPSGTPSSSQPTPQTPATAQPGAPVEGSATQTPITPVEPHVPWGRFREVQTQYTQLRRQMADADTKYQQQIQQFQTDQQRFKQSHDDFTVLEQLLEANPDLAETLYERAKGGGTNLPGARGARPGQPSTPSPEILALQKELSGVKEILTSAQQRQVQQQQAVEDHQTLTQLRGNLGALLKERDIDEVFLPQAEAYVLRRVREMPDLGMEEVPYLFAEWYKPFADALNKQVQRMRSGKQEAAGLPATPGAAPAITQTPSLKTHVEQARSLEELLRQRGWNNGET